MWIDSHVGRAGIMWAHYWFLLLGILIQKSLFSLISIFVFYIEWSSVPREVG